MRLESAAGLSSRTIVCARLFKTLSRPFETVPPHRSYTILTAQREIRYIMGNLKHFYRRHAQSAARRIKSSGRFD